MLKAKINILALILGLYKEEIITSVDELKKLSVPKKVMLTYHQVTDI